MVISISEFYALRRDLSLNFADAAQALGERRADDLSLGLTELTTDDRRRMKDYAEQRDAKIERLRQAERDRIRNFFGGR
ncbi:MAG: hypothetical protein ACOYJV_00155 [Aminivibrio sp.]|jgi:hypothetical protein